MNFLLYLVFKPYTSLDITKKCYMRLKDMSKELFKDYA